MLLVFGQGMIPAGIGLTAGLAASMGVNQVLKAELVNVSPADPAAYAAATTALILAAIPGCLIPALRAIRLDPAVALRQD